MSSLLQSTQLTLNGIAKYIGSLLDGLPVIAGDPDTRHAFGSRFTDFVVETTIPKVS